MVFHVCSPKIGFISSTLSSRKQWETNINLDLAKASSKPEIIETPDYFSWKNYEDRDWTTPAKHQGNCGSCWDFAAVGVLESVINIREGCAELDPDLSEQYVLSCLPGAGSCRGGSSYKAFELIKSTDESGNYCNGIITEECMPYQADDDISCSDKSDNWEENWYQSQIMVIGNLVIQSRIEKQ